MHSLNQLSIDTVTINQPFLVREQNYRCQRVCTDYDLIDWETVGMVISPYFLTSNNVVKENTAIQT